MPQKLFLLQRSSNEKWSFFTETVFIDSILNMMHIKIKITPWCLARRTGWKHDFFNLEESISKFDFRSVQVKFRSRSGRDRSRSICISSEAARRAKSLGTICASLSPPYRIFFLSKTGFWPHLTSDDFLVTPIISCTCTITDGLSGHDPERIGWFRLICAKREAFSHFPVAL